MGGVGVVAGVLADGAAGFDGGALLVALHLGVKHVQGELDAARGHDLDASWDGLAKQHHGGCPRGPGGAGAGGVAAAQHLAVDVPELS